MRYLLLVHLDADRMSRLSAEDGEVLERASVSFDQELKRSGKAIALGPLAESDPGTIVRPGRDGPVLTDGPFIEAKEHVGGFLLLEVKDRQEALDIASAAPISRYGAIEVREVRRG